MKRKSVGEIRKSQKESTVRKNLIDFLKNLIDFLKNLIDFLEKLT